MIGLGAMPFSVYVNNNQIGKQVIRHYILKGGRFIDTAYSYAQKSDFLGHNEQLIRDALKNFLTKKSNIFIATKAGYNITSSGEWILDCSPRFLRFSCEQSLRNLKLECLHLIQLHAPPKIEYEYALALMTLNDLKKEGKVKRIGICNVNLEQLRIACNITNIYSVQNRFNILNQQDLNNGVLELCRTNNIVYIAYCPFGNRFKHQEVVKSNPKITSIARKYGVSNYVIALSYILNLDYNMIPIPSTTDISHLDENLKALNITLNIEELSYLTT